MKISEVDADLSNMRKKSDAKIILKGYNFSVFVWIDKPLKVNHIHVELSKQGWMQQFGS